MDAAALLSSGYSELHSDTQTECKLVQSACDLNVQALPLHQEGKPGETESRSQ